MKISLKVGLNDCEQRLSKFIEKTFPKFPKSAIYKAIRTKKIKINGGRCEAGSILKFGDLVEVFGFAEFVEKNRLNCVSKLLFNGELDVVYEDENLLVVNKPVGLRSHPCKPGDDSLISRILAYLIKNEKFVLQNENSFVPGICNRLDTNTSGLVVAAKNFKALRCLNELLKTRKIIKTYACMVEGVFEKSSGTLTNWLVKNGRTKKSVVSGLRLPNAKQAILQYFVMKQFLNFAKVRIILHTGRFHQIRAQLANEGHPLLGDVKYGAKLKNEKMRLCAYELVFNTKNSMFDYLDGKKIKLNLNF